MLGLVLLTAVSHALWNAWLKVTGDRVAALALMGASYLATALAALPFVGWPARAAWGYLAASALVHTAYPLALIGAFRLGDLGVVYPLSRGTGPLLVTMVATVFLGDALNVSGIVAVGLIVAGVVALGLHASVRDPATAALAVLAGGLIAAYTLLDGLGGRASPSAHAYVVWLFLFSGASLVIVAAWTRGPRRLWRLARPIWWQGVSAGVVSAGAYWIIIWAMRIAPMGLVAAARETSVAFAALIAGFGLRERVRWPAVALVLTGIVLVRLAAG